MSKIFGGSKTTQKQSSQQTSENRAFAPIKEAFMPGATGAFQAGASALTDELAGGYEGYKKNTGYDFWRNLGLRKTAGGFSGRGLYNSGATLKALANYEEGIGSASYNDYLQQQAALAGLGIQGGGLVSGAGNYSQGTSEGSSVTKSTPGLSGFIGNITSGISAFSKLKGKG